MSESITPSDACGGHRRLVEERVELPQGVRSVDAIAVVMCRAPGTLDARRGSAATTSGASDGNRRP